MKLSWFEIKNFKSIKESGRCHLASDVTVLAGKNESGKTSILEALTRLKNDFTNDDLPLTDKESIPTVIAEFELSDSYISKLKSNDLLKDIDLEKLPKSFIHISKYENSENLFEVEGEIPVFFKKIIDKENREKSELIESNISSLIKELEKFGHSYNLEKKLLDISLPSFIEIDYILKVIPDLTNIVDSISDPNILKEKLKSNLSHSEELVRKIESNNTIIKEVKDVLYDLIPNFVYFNAFDDILPSEISVDDAKQNKTVVNFCSVSGLNLDSLKTETRQFRRNILELSEEEITGKFQKFWKQGKLKFSVEIDSGNLAFFVKEGRKPSFLFKQRSKGLQWFVSFFLTLNAEAKKSGNILLIDEPGSYLHAKAQEDVLDILQEISKENQIIFTTHSPYLIDPDRLDRIRLVLRETEEDFTRIEGKIHKTESQETLTPIITAIGLDISRSLVSLGENNVFVEGISDYYFLKAMEKYLKLKQNFRTKNQLNLIPCTGAQKIPQLVSLSIGWDLNHAVLLDNDSEGNLIQKDLLEKLDVSPKIIVKVSDTIDYSIEDLFIKNDFENHILNESVLQNKKNSDSIKGKDKVLKSKLFFNKVNKNEIQNLNNNTLENFKKIFSNLDKCFGYCELTVVKSPIFRDNPKVFDAKIIKGSIKSNSNLKMNGKNFTINRLVKNGKIVEQVNTNDFVTIHTSSLVAGKDFKEGDSLRFTI